MSRFEEASSLHNAVHVLQLRAQSATPTLSLEQRAKRIAMIEIMCGLLSKARDDAIALGIHEWETHIKEGA